MGFENPLSPPLPPPGLTPLKSELVGCPASGAIPLFPPPSKAGRDWLKATWFHCWGGGIGDSRDVVTCGGLGLTAVVCMHRSSRSGMVPLRRDGHWPGAWLCHRLPGGPGHVTFSEPICVLMALLCSPGARFPGEGPAQPWLGEGGTCLQVLQ